MVSGLPTTAGPCSRTRVVLASRAERARHRACGTSRCSTQRAASPSAATSRDDLRRPRTGRRDRRAQDVALQRGPRSPDPARLPVALAAARAPSVSSRHAIRAGVAALRVLASRRFRRPRSSACAGWARRAEELGFDSVWVSDHFYYSFARYGADPSPIGPLEPMTTLAGLAARTERVRLGTLVLCAPFRHPAAARARPGVARCALGRPARARPRRGMVRGGVPRVRVRFGSVGERSSGSRKRSRSSPLSPGTNRPPTRARRSRSTMLGRCRARCSDRSRSGSAAREGRGCCAWPPGTRAGWNVVWRMSARGLRARRSTTWRAACEAEGRDPATFGLSVGLYGARSADEDEARASVRTRPGARCPATRSARRRGRRGARTRCREPPTRCVSASPRSRRWGSQEMIWSPWVLPFAIRNRRGGAVRRAGPRAAARRSMNGEPGLQPRRPERGAPRAR